MKTSGSRSLSPDVGKRILSKTGGRCHVWGSTWTEVGGLPYPPSGSSRDGRGEEESSHAQ